MRQPWTVFVYAFMATALILGLILLGPKSSACRDSYRNDVKIKFGVNTIQVEKATTQPQREKGLSGRSCIGPNQGMLFVFDKPGYYSFWMKDMRFPIDIIWIDSNKKIVFEKENLAPSSYPDSVSSQTPAQYVLELAAGRADKLGLKTGQQLYYY